MENTVGAVLGYSHTVLDFMLHAVNLPKHRYHFGSGRSERQQ
jgi:hypothetical protein